MWPFSRYFGRAAAAYRDVTDESIDRANVYVVAPDDTRLPVSEFTRSRLAEKAEGVRQRFGVVQEWGRGIARHTVGRGIAAQFNTTSLEWNKEATLAVERFMMNKNQCDLSRRRTGYEQQLHMAEQFALQNEAIVAYLENPAFPAPGDKAGVGACPCFFNIASSDVRTPPNSRDKPIYDGLELGKFGETLRYHVRSWGKDEYTVYEAANVAHIFDGHGPHQSRGITPLAPALNKLVDVDELRRLETRTAKAHRQVALIIKGVAAKKGRGALAELKKDSTGAVSTDTAAMEQLYGGAGAAIARLSEEGNVELLSSNSPSPALNAFFNDLLLRDASAALGIPLEFFWNPEKLGGANIRGIYARADATFQQIADKIIYGFFEPLIVRFIRWRVASGLLAEPPGGINGPWLDSITYRRPRRVTLDNGKDSTARINDLDHGLANLRGLYDENGEDWLPETDQWIDEWIIFEDRCKKKGLSEKRIEQLMARWRPAKPGALPAQPAPAQQTDATETEPQAAAA